MAPKNRKEDQIKTPEDEMPKPLEVTEDHDEREDGGLPVADEDIEKLIKKASSTVELSLSSKSIKAIKKTKPKKKDTTPIENYDDFFKKRKGIINRVFTKKSPVFKFLPAKTPVEKLDGWRKDNKDKLNERNLLKDTDVDLSTLTWLKDKYYIQLAQNTSDIKFESIVRILKTYDIPVDTLKEENKIRKFIICKGISCSVAKFE